MDSEIMIRDPFVQMEDGLWLPKPKGKKVTNIWLGTGQIIKVAESIDYVLERVNRLLNRSSQWEQFTDFAFEDEPVYVFADADIVAINTGYEDLEAIQLGQKEADLAKRMREQALGKASFDLALKAKKG